MIWHNLLHERRLQNHNLIGQVPAAVSQLLFSNLLSGPLVLECPQFLQP